MTVTLLRHSIRAMQSQKAVPEEGHLEVITEGINELHLPKYN